MMSIREGFKRWFTGKKRSDEKASPCSASRFRSGSLRSPPLHREAEQLLQSVTYAVRIMCNLCGEAFPSVALPSLALHCQEFVTEPVE